MSLSGLWMMSSRRHKTRFPCTDKAKCTSCRDDSELGWLSLFFFWPKN